MPLKRFIICKNSPATHSAKPTFKQARARQFLQMIKGPVNRGRKNNMRGGVPGVKMDLQFAHDGF